MEVFRENIFNYQSQKRKDKKMSKRNFMFSICTMLFLVVLASIGLSGCYSKKEYIPQEGKVTSRTDIVQVQNEYGKYFYVSINKTKNSYTYCSKTEDGEKIEKRKRADSCNTMRCIIRMPDELSEEHHQQVYGFYCINDDN